MSESGKAHSGTMRMHPTGVRSGASNAMILGSDRRVVAVSTVKVNGSVFGF